MEQWNTSKQCKPEDRVSLHDLKRPPREVARIPYRYCQQHQNDQRTNERRTKDIKPVKLVKPALGAQKQSQLSVPWDFRAFKFSLTNDPKIPKDLSFIYCDL